MPCQSPNNTSVFLQLFQTIHEHNQKHQPAPLPSTQERHFDPGRSILCDLCQRVSGRHEPANRKVTLIHLEPPCTYLGLIIILESCLLDLLSKCYEMAAFKATHLALLVPRHESAIPTKLYKSHTNPQTNNRKNRILTSCGSSMYVSNTGGSR